MGVDIAIATPAFLDLTFVGLEALPGPGDECFAGDLKATPGGGAITAVGATRLGMTAALVAPLADDGAGRVVREALEAEGVQVGPPRGARTPVTVVMPVDGDRAMVTVDPGVRVTPAEIAAVDPAAVVGSVELADLMPPGPRVYLTCGDDDARAYAGRLRRGNASTRALIVNRREAALLTGATSAAAAAGALASAAQVAIVNEGVDGVTAATGDRVLRVPGIDVGPGVDPTGDRDLLAAALAWADLHNAELEEQIRYAVLYAALSSTVPTGTAGAVDASRLCEEAARRGIAPLQPAA